MPIAAARDLFEKFQALAPDARREFRDLLSDASVYTPTVGQQADLEQSLASMRAGKLVGEQRIREILQHK